MIQMVATAERAYDFKNHDLPSPEYIKIPQPLLPLEFHQIESPHIVFFVVKGERGISDSTM